MDVIPKAVKEEVLACLSGSGRDFEVTADLCELSVRRDPLLADIASHRDVKIVACFPRAVRGLFKAAGVPLPEKGVEILNMRSEPAEKIIQALFGEPAGGRAAA
jgi:hypothetical protein